jgi:hypothetical protein
MFDSIRPFCRAMTEKLGLGDIAGLLQLARFMSETPTTVGWKHKYTSEVHRSSNEAWTLQKEHGALSEPGRPSFL